VEGPVRYKLVMFDFDGTLADSLPWFASVINAVADTYRFKRIAAHEVDQLRGYNARQIMRHLGVPMWRLPFIARHMQALTAANIDRVALFDGIDRVLDDLAKAGITIGVVTSNAEANVRRVLGPANAARVAYYECGVSMFGKHSRFRAILKRSGMSPQHALYIGDELRDYEAASRAGIRFGAVAWGFTRIDALLAHQPDEVFRQVDDLRALADPVSGAAAGADRHES
jgi:phosphoglycolate phosphatase